MSPSPSSPSISAERKTALFVCSVLLLSCVCLWGIGANVAHVGSLQFEDEQRREELSPSLMNFYPSFARWPPAMLPSDSREPWDPSSLSNPSSVISVGQSSGSDAELLICTTHSVAIGVMSSFYPELPHGANVHRSQVDRVRREIEGVLRQFRVQTVEKEMLTPLEGETTSAFWRITVASSAADELVTTLRNLTLKLSTPRSTVVLPLAESRASIEFSASSHPTSPTGDWQLQRQRTPRYEQHQQPLLDFVSIDELAVSVAVEEARVVRVRALYEGVVNASERVSLLPTLLAFEREAKLQRSRLNTLVESQRTSLLQPTVGIQISLIQQFDASVTREMDRSLHRDIRRGYVDVVLWALLLVLSIAGLVWWPGRTRCRDPSRS